MSAHDMHEVLVHRAHKAIFLGHIPMHGRRLLTSGCTDKHALSIMAAARDHEIVFVDVKSHGLVMYHVDAQHKVTKRRYFNLARILYCSGDATEPGCTALLNGVFSWVYQQELVNEKTRKQPLQVMQNNEHRYQRECYAVKMKSQEKSRLLALLVNSAFQVWQKEIKEALEMSKLFQKSYEDQRRASLIANYSYKGLLEHEQPELSDDIDFL